MKNPSTTWTTLVAIFIVLLCICYQASAAEYNYNVSNSAITVTIVQGNSLNDDYNIRGNPDICLTLSVPSCNTDPVTDYLQFFSPIGNATARATLTGIIPATTLTFNNPNATIRFVSDGDYFFANIPVTITPFACQRPALPTLPPVVVQQSMDSALISWTAPGSLLSAYDLYRNGVMRTTVSSPSFVDTGLVPFSNYSYSFISKNSFGNSDISPSFNFTPQALAAPAPIIEWPLPFGTDCGIILSRTNGRNATFPPGVGSTGSIAVTTGPFGDVVGSGASCLFSGGSYLNGTAAGLSVNMPVTNAVRTIVVTFRSLSTPSTSSPAFLFSQVQSASASSLVAGSAVGLAIENSTSLLFASPNCSTRYRVPNGVNITDGRWHQLSVSFPGTSSLMRAFIDGQSAFSGSLSCLITMGQTMQIARAPQSIWSGSVPFTGAIDQVTVHNRLFTDLEMCSLWHQTRLLSLLPGNSSTSLSIRWHRGLASDITHYIVYVQGQYVANVSAPNNQYEHMLNNPTHGQVFAASVSACSWLCCGFMSLPLNITFFTAQITMSAVPGGISALPGSTFTVFATLSGLLPPPPLDLHSAVELGLPITPSVTVELALRAGFISYFTPASIFLSMASNVSSSSVTFVTAGQSNFTARVNGPYAAWFNVSWSSLPVFGLPRVQSIAPNVSFSAGGSLLYLQTTPPLAIETLQLSMLSCRFTRSDSTVVIRPAEAMDANGVACSSPPATLGTTMTVQLRFGANSFAIGNQSVAVIPNPLLASVTSNSAISRCDGQRLILEGTNIPPAGSFSSSFCTFNISSIMRSTQLLIINSTHAICFSPLSPIASTAAVGLQFDNGFFPSALSLSLGASALPSDCLSATTPTLPIPPAVSFVMPLGDDCGASLNNIGAVTYVDSLSGGPALLTLGSLGIPNTGCSFTGSKYQAKITPYGSDLPSGSSGRTMVLVFKLNIPSRSDGPIYYQYSGNDMSVSGSTWGIDVTNSGSALLFRGLDCNFLIPGTFADGLWHFVSVSFDPITSLMDVFVDGTRPLALNPAIKTCINTKSTTYYIGTDAGTTNIATVDIDYIRFYAYPLLPQDIGGLYLDTQISDIDSGNTSTSFLVRWFRPLDPSVTQYLLYRNGSLVQLVPAPALSVIDEVPSPTQGAVYVYTVQACNAQSCSRSSSSFSTVWFAATVFLALPPPVSVSGPPYATSRIMFAVPPGSIPSTSLAKLNITVSGIVSNPSMIELNATTPNRNMTLSFTQDNSGIPILRAFASGAFANFFTLSYNPSYPVIVAPRVFSLFPRVAWESGGNLVSINVTRLAVGTNASQISCQFASGSTTAVSATGTSIQCPTPPAGTTPFDTPVSFNLTIGVLLIRTNLAIMYTGNPTIVGALNTTVTTLCGGQEVFIAGTNLPSAGNVSQAWCLFSHNVQRPLRLINSTFASCMSPPTFTAPNQNTMLSFTVQLDAAIFTSTAAGGGNLTFYPDPALLGMACPNPISIPGPILVPTMTWAFPQSADCRVPSVGLGATAYGGLPTLTTDRWGTASSACSFSGTQYMQSQHSFMPAGAANRTFAMWFKASQLQGTVPLFLTFTNSTNVTGSSFGLQLSGNGTVLRFAGSGDCTFDVPLVSTLIDALWHHVAAVFDFPTLRMYVDGLLVASPTMRCIRSGVSSTNILSFARDLNLTAMAKADFDDMRYFDYALSNTEICSISQETSIFLFDTSLDSNSVALTWLAPPISRITYYLVSRNGLFLANVSAPQTTYVDLLLNPLAGAATPSYTVAACSDACCGRVSANISRTYWRDNLTIVGVPESVSAPWTPVSILFNTTGSFVRGTQVRLDATLVGNITTNSPGFVRINDSRISGFQQVTFADAGILRLQLSRTGRFAGWFVPQNPEFTVTVAPRILSIFPATSWATGGRLMTMFTSRILNWTVTTETTQIRLRNNDPAYSSDIQTTPILDLQSNRVSLSTPNGLAGSSYQIWFGFNGTFVDTGSFLLYTVDPVFNTMNIYASPTSGGANVTIRGTNIPSAFNISSAFCVWSQANTSAVADPIYGIPSEVCINNTMVNGTWVPTNGTVPNQSFVTNCSSIFPLRMPAILINSTTAVCQVPPSPGLTLSLSFAIDNASFNSTNLPMRYYPTPSFSAGIWPRNGPNGVGTNVTVFGMNVPTISMASTPFQCAFYVNSSFLPPLPRVCLNITAGPNCTGSNWTIPASPPTFRYITPAIRMTNTSLSCLSPVIPLTIPSGTLADAQITILVDNLEYNTTQVFKYFARANLTAPIPAAAYRSGNLALTMAGSLLSPPADPFPEVLCVWTFSASVKLWVFPASLTSDRMVCISPEIPPALANTSWPLLPTFTVLYNQAEVYRMPGTFVFINHPVVPQLSSTGARVSGGNHLTFNPQGFTAAPYLFSYFLQNSYCLFEMDVQDVLAQLALQDAIAHSNRCLNGTSYPSGLEDVILNPQAVFSNTTVVLTPLSTVPARANFTSIINGVMAGTTAFNGTLYIRSQVANISSPDNNSTLLAADCTCAVEVVSTSPTPLSANCSCVVTANINAIGVNGTSSGTSATPYDTCIVFPTFPPPNNSTNPPNYAPLPAALFAVVTPDNGLSNISLAALGINPLTTLNSSSILGRSAQFSTIDMMLTPLGYNSSVTSADETTLRLILNASYPISDGILNFTARAANISSAPNFDNSLPRIDWTANCNCTIRLSPLPVYQLQEAFTSLYPFANAIANVRACECILARVIPIVNATNTTNVIRFELRAPPLPILPPVDVTVAAPIPASPMLAPRLPDHPVTMEGIANSKLFKFVPTELVTQLGSPAQQLRCVSPSFPLTRNATVSFMLSGNILPSNSFNISIYPDINLLTVYPRAMTTLNQRQLHIETARTNTSLYTTVNCLFSPWRNLTMYQVDSSTLIYPLNWTRWLNGNVSYVERVLYHPAADVVGLCQLPAVFPVTGVLHPYLLIDNYPTLLSDNFLFRVHPPNTPLPVAIIDGPTSIGPCDPLALSGFNSKPNPNPVQRFWWTVSAYSNTTLQAETLVLNSPRLSISSLPPNATYSVTLMVENAFNLTSTIVSTDVFIAPFSVPRLQVSPATLDIKRSTLVLVQALGSISICSNDSLADNGTVSLGYSWSINTTLPFSVVTNNSILTIPANTLRAATTYILTAQTFVRSSAERTATSSVLVNVGVQDLVITIAGGDRSVPIGADVLLDASASYDPDDIQAFNATYTWSCSFPGSADTCFIILGRTSAFTVSTRSLTVGRRVRFDLVYAKGPLRRATASVTWTGISQAAPSVSIITQSDVWSRSSTNILTASFLRPIDSSTTMVWSCREINLAANPTAYLDSPLNRENLVFKPQTLPPGTYSFQLNATNSAGTASSLKTIRVNAPPENGTFFVVPAAGSPLDTSFALSAVDWADMDAPLTYTFFTRLEGKAEKVALSAPSFATSMSVQGLQVGTNYISVRIADSYGSFVWSPEVSVNISFPIIVANGGASDSSNATSALIAAASNAINGSIAASLASGNQQQVLGLVSTVASLLNADTAISPTPAAVIANPNITDPATELRKQLREQLLNSVSSAAAAAGSSTTPLTNEEASSRFNSVLQITQAPKELSENSKKLALNILTSSLSSSSSASSSSSSSAPDKSTLTLAVGIMSNILSTPAFAAMNNLQVPRVELPVATNTSVNGTNANNGTVVDNNASTTNGTQLTAEQVVLRDLAYQITDLTKNVASSVASSLVSGQDPVFISTDQLTIGVKRDSPSRIAGGTISGSASSTTSGSFSLPSNLFSSAALSSSITAVDTHLIEYKTNIYGFSGTALSGSITEFSIHANNSEVSINGLTSPISIGLPVNFSFPLAGSANYSTNASCVFWNTTSAAWDTNGCTAVSLSATQTICQCTHLTSFSAQVFEIARPPIRIITINIVKIINMRQDTIILVCVIYGIYVAAVIWGRGADLRDAKRKLVEKKSTVANRIERLKLIDLDAANRTKAAPVGGLQKPAGLSAVASIRDVDSDSDSEDDDDENKAATAGHKLKSVSPVSSPSKKLPKPLPKAAGKTRNALTSSEIKGATGVKLRISKAFERNFGKLFWQRLQREHVWLGVLTGDPDLQTSRPAKATIALGMLLSSLLCGALFFGVQNTNPAQSIAVGILCGIVAFPVTTVLSRLFVILNRSERSEVRGLSGQEMVQIMARPDLASASSAPSSAALAAAASPTANASASDMHRLWKFLDRKKKGKITQEDLKYALLRASKSELALDSLRLSAIFEWVDQNRNGSWSEKEFERVFALYLSSQEREELKQEEIVKLLLKADRDKKGYITRPDLRRLLTEDLKSPMDDTTFEALWHFMDSNGDGTLSHTEFRANFQALMRHDSLLDESVAKERDERTMSVEEKNEKERLRKHKEAQEAELATCPDVQFFLDIVDSSWKIMLALEYDDKHRKGILEKKKANLAASEASPNAKNNPPPAHPLGAKNPSFGLAAFSSISKVHPTPAASSLDRASSARGADEVDGDGEHTFSASSAPVLNAQPPVHSSLKYRVKSMNPSHPSLDLQEIEQPNNKKPKSMSLHPHDGDEDGETVQVLSRDAVTPPITPKNGRSHANSPTASKNNLSFAARFFGLMDKFETFLYSKTSKVVALADPSLLDQEDDLSAIAQTRSSSMVMYTLSLRRMAVAAVGFIFVSGLLAFLASLLLDVQMQDAIILGCVPLFILAFMQQPRMALFSLYCMVIAFIGKVINIYLFDLADDWSILDQSFDNSRIMIEMVIDACLIHGPFWLHAFMEWRRYRSLMSLADSLELPMATISWALSMTYALVLYPLGEPVHVLLICAIVPSLLHRSWRFAKAHSGNHAAVLLTSCLFGAALSLILGLRQAVFGKTELYFADALAPGLSIAGVGILIAYRMWSAKQAQLLEEGPKVEPEPWPFWATYIVYAFTFLLFAGETLVIMVYANELVDSQQWAYFLAVLVSFVQEVFLVQPLRIFGGAIGAWFSGKVLGGFPTLVSNCLRGMFRRRR